MALTQINSDVFGVLVSIAQGGTNATTATGALTSLLPSGAQTGYVLTTGGAGSYYWAASQGGSGSTVGQTLTTTRQSNTASSGQTVFNLVNGITYTPGAGQLRVYINGVRQFPSEYTETSTNVYTLTSGVSSGDIVFAEIDNFSTFNNYANLTYASNIGNIAAVGLTVQSAINTLENNKAPLSAPVFTSNVTVGANLKFTNWSTYQAGDKLYFAYDGVVKMSINSNGNLIVAGDITAFGTP